MLAESAFSASNRRRLIAMPASSSLSALLHRYRRGEADPGTEIEAALAHSNSNGSHNVYLAQDAAFSLGEAVRLRRDDMPQQPLWGIPVSLKDCFDLAGFPTSCGSAFRRAQHGVAAEDSAVAARLRSAGAVLTGKTHLHQLAYGITGESADFGDCLQPSDPTRLTGGSSSGAAASVQEGSALAAIGTDTGGSIRVPAALCGLAGYRSSITLNCSPHNDIWRGGSHLAPSFDTIGWLYRDLRDGPRLASALFNLPPAETVVAMETLRIGIPERSFFYDAEPAVLATLERWRSIFAAQDATVSAFDATLWQDATDILTPIQAREASVLNLSLLEHLEPVIGQRLVWGNSITPAELSVHHQRLTDFRQQTLALFQAFDYLLLPCAPIAALFAGEDQSTARMRILRYTAPISLCGLPTVALPGGDGTGLQLVGRLSRDAELLALSAQLADLA
jgi:aspartyl-tRNA(Asn)/glutamyl-tRNA(Gln) amidotransferase subunit A